MRRVTVTPDSVSRDPAEKPVWKFIRFAASLRTLTKLQTVRLRIEKPVMPWFYAHYLALRQIAIGDRLYCNKGEAAYEDEHYAMIFWYHEEVYHESGRHMQQRWRASRRQQ